jgi:hypothetical protein
LKDTPLIPKQERQFEDFHQGTEWFEKNRAMLSATYPEEFVAVYKTKVIDHDKSLDVLLKRLRSTHDDPTLNGFVIEFVWAPGTEPHFILGPLGVM